MPACGVDANGWSKKIINDRTLCFIKYDHQQLLMGSIIRPKSLKGIENNNGWITIVDENSFPKDGFMFMECVTKSGHQATHHFLVGDEKYMIDKFSHYKIMPFLKPLY